MLSTDSISETRSSMTSFSGSIKERPGSQGISMVETMLNVTELCFLEPCKSSTSFNGQSEFRRMERALRYSHQARTVGNSDDVIEKTANEPLQLSSSSKLIRLTPLDFANFLPWLCAAWQSPQYVHVTTVVQEEYVNTSKASKSSLKSKSRRKVELPQINEESKLLQSSLVERPLLVTATFDSKSHLVEIAITERDINIHRKTIQAISVCIPFHCLLYRLTLRWTKIDNIVIYEIAKCLPNSYFTDIILDDTRGRPNYDVLLSKESPLKYLSLNRCQIDDDQCKKIAANIDSGSGGATLNVLELSSNLITDVGALALAESLRRNRNLMHLNLSGNMLTDEGAIPLLSHLMKFRVREDELMERKKRNIQYVQNKLKTYESCYKEVLLKRQRHEDLKKRGRVQKTDSKVSNKEQDRKISSSFDCNEATKMTLQSVGEFIDPFDERSTISENERVYCTGNVILCSLNLAYNNLNYYSLQKIYDVLKYQYEMMASEGLKRIVLFGNQFPVDCELYSDITNYLLNSVNMGLQKTQKTSEKSIKQKPRKSKIRLM